MMDGYQKSVIDVKIKFDEERERQFRDWLDKEYHAKRDSISDGSEHTISDVLSIKPSNLSRYLDEDFAKRETEVDCFRKVSLNAIASPLLTKALVRKTRERLAQVKVTKKEKWKPIDKFRWTARIIVVLVTTALRWRRYSGSTKRKLADNSRPSKALLPRLPSKRKSLRRRSTTHNIGFDSADYSKCENKTPHELEEILTKAPHKRTSSELLRVHKFCRGLGVLSNFPVNREIDASRLVAYERYDKGRIICLQDRIPQRFYYVLAGRVLKVRSITFTNGIEKKYYGELHKGQTTDAEELQSEQKRDCTLMCTNNVEVLLFEKEDFMDLLNSKSNMESNTWSFLRSIDMFKTFPVEQLAEDDGSVITKYYPKDTVIVSNLKDTDNIFVVKTGICKILRKIFTMDNTVPLRSSESCLFPKIEISNTERDGSSGSNYNRSLEEAKRLRYEAKLLLHEINPEDEEHLEENKRRNSYLGYRQSARSAKSRHEAWSPRLSKKSVKRRKDSEANEVFSSPRSSVSQSAEIDNLALPLITSTNSIRSKSKEESLASTSGNMSLPSLARHSLLHIGSLKRGDVYGIDSILHRARSIVQSSVPLQVSFSEPNCENLILLSEGAECVLIKKSIFLQKADFCTLAKIVSSQNGSSSNLEILQVDRERAWKDYKKKTVSKLLQGK